jgi:hypothetical protein
VGKAVEISGNWDVVAQLGRHLTQPRTNRKLSVWWKPCCTMVTSNRLKVTGAQCQVFGPDLETYRKVGLPARLH